MIIYKITNKNTGKMYIGQTINSLEKRWKRHCNDAINNKLNTHFARAIRLYGPENFTTEIIDTAESQDELTAKEQYWIRFYDTINTGYNETDATNKSGGNTYQGKSQEELDKIKEKLRITKLGANNPHATSVKCKNIKTNEEYHFGSQSEMQVFFNETNHQFCSRRCLGEIKCLYKNEWLIAYEDNDYPSDYTLKGKTPKKGSQIRFIDNINNKIYNFNSIREAERELKEKGYNIPSRSTIGKILKNIVPQKSEFTFENIE